MIMGILRTPYIEGCSTRHTPNGFEEEEQINNEKRTEEAATPSGEERAKEFAKAHSLTLDRSFRYGLKATGVFDHLGSSPLLALLGKLEIVGQIPALNNNDTLADFGITKERDGSLAVLGLSCESVAVFVFVEVHSTIIRALNNESCELDHFILSFRLLFVG